MQLAYPKEAQLKPGAFRPQVCHGAMTFRRTISKNTHDYNSILRIYVQWHIPIIVHRLVILLNCKWLLNLASFVKTSGQGASPFPGLLHFTLDAFLIMLSVKQGAIKYHFLSLCYHSTWDWTPVSWTNGKHSTHKPITRCTQRELFNI